MNIIFKINVIVYILQLEVESNC